MMVSWTVILVVLFGAAFAGLTLGLLGGGIGLVLVPLLAWLLEKNHVPNALIMHLAVGTAVAVTVVVGFFASYKHHVTGKVNWSIVKMMSSGVIIGSVLGALIAKYLPNQMLMLIFSTVTFLFALQLCLSYQKKSSTKIFSNTVKINTMVISSFVIGFLGSVLGANPFCVPLLKKMNDDIVEAIATTVVIGTIMAMIVIPLFIILAWSEQELPSYTTGYIVWPLFFPIAIISSLFVPMGVKLAGYFSKKTLHKLYIGLLLTIAIKMLYASTTLSS